MNRLIRMSLLLVLVSCDGSGGGTGGGSGGDAGGSNCDLPLSQPISAPCCEERGIDACGASLFCAAFDGRSQATCYPERSRRDGESCGENRHCTSGECNIELAACKAIPTAECTIELGCARSPTGDVMVCAPLDGSLRCLPTKGGSGDPCAADSDCTSRRCEEGRCACIPNCDGRSCGDDGCGGSCGSCGSKGTCTTQGQCMCDDDLKFCDGACIDPFTDSNNCGACGKKCTGATHCFYSGTIENGATCRSDDYYYLDDEDLGDCMRTCKRNGYPRCWSAGGGGCFQPSRSFCICERDPS